MMVVVSTKTVEVLMAAMELDAGARYVSATFPLFYSTHLTLFFRSSIRFTEGGSAWLLFGCR